MANLGTFEGSPVTKAGITIPGLAGGLRDAMRIDPEAFRKGERLFVVAECTVIDVDMEAIDKDDPAGDQRRVHTLGVEAATIVEREVVAEALDRHRERLQVAKDAEAQQHTIQLAVDHNEGQHATRKVAGCQECEANAAAAASAGPDQPEPLATGKPPAKKAAARKQAAKKAGAKASVRSLAEKRDEKEGT